MLRTRAITTLDSDNSDTTECSTWDGSLRVQPQANQPRLPPLTQEHKAAKCKDRKGN